MNVEDLAALREAQQIVKDHRIGTCRAVAEYVREAQVVTLLPCALEVHHYPATPHRALALDGTETGVWDDQPSVGRHPAGSSR